MNKKIEKDLNFKESPMRNRIPKKSTERNRNTSNYKIKLAKIDTIKGKITKFKLRKTRRK